MKDNGPDIPKQRNSQRPFRPDWQLVTGQVSHILSALVKNGGGKKDPNITYNMGAEIRNIWAPGDHVKQTEDAERMAAFLSLGGE